MKKRVLKPERLRKVPDQFRWIDHRLVHENYFVRCHHSAWALYLFLVSVGDAQGLNRRAKTQSDASRLAAETRSNRGQRNETRTPEQ